jgi:hypothetical protein
LGRKLRVSRGDAENAEKETAEKNRENGGSLVPPPFSFPITTFCSQAVLYTSAESG